MNFSRVHSFINFLHKARFVLSWRLRRNKLLCKMHRALGLFARLFSDDREQRLFRRGKTRIRGAQESEMLRQPLLKPLA